MLNNKSLLAYPMHGQHKLVSEGYRTRDGHLIEWFGKKLKDQAVTVVSRPEPIYLARLKHRYDKRRVAANTIPVDTTTWRLPNVRQPKKWWVDSISHYPKFEKNGQHAIVWNPLIGLAANVPASVSGCLAVDLLDDWTVHHHFKDLKIDLERAYGRLFDLADTVTANSEGTYSLAQRFGRTDVHLLTNGCDPERFTIESKAAGPTTVGYVGKIGKRLDTDLIANVTRTHASKRFVFAGPILDREVGVALRAIPNVVLLGDVHYNDVPSLLTTFDIGWVPHNTGEYEVGGDVIKTYEYRAAHLPVLTTPLIGAGSRGLSGVTVLPAAEQTDWLASLNITDGRVGRVSGDIPPEHTWSYKADFLLRELGLQ